jgi:hypothetical protein
VGEPLRLYTHSYTERLSRYRADPGSCNACPLKPECTPGDGGRVLMRSFEEELLERVRAYRQTGPYEKALGKRKVWVEPMFGEAKEWHGMRRFRLRRLWRVNAEAMVIAAGQNIKRLLTYSGGGPRRLAQAEALRPPAPTSWASGRLLRGSHRRGSTPLLARFSTGWGVLRNSGTPFVLWGTYCASAHTLPSHKSMMPLLRAQLTPRKGAGQLPALLLDQG